MNIPFGATKILAVMALVVCSQSFAAEPMLFRASNFLSPASEAQILSDKEKQMVGSWRTSWHTKSVSVAAVDTSVLRSSTISLEMPDRNVYHFRGVEKDLASQGSPGSIYWAGTALAVGVKSAADSHASAERRVIPFPQSLDLVFERDRKSFSGRLHIEGRNFSLNTLNAKYMLLVESGPNPAAPPLDAEPPRPRQSRPLLSGRDWPPGLLSEKLKASLASSAIGGSVSPEHCDQISSCGTVTRISCHPERDGAEMFFDNTTGALIMGCGGYCLGGSGSPGSKRCTACPPPEWKDCSDKPADSQRKVSAVSLP